MDNISTRLKELRKRKRLSMADLERAWNVPKDRIYKWEGGTRPTDPRDYLGLLAFLKSENLESFTKAASDPDSFNFYSQDEINELIDLKTNERMKAYEDNLLLPQGVPVYDTEFSMGMVTSFIEARMDAPLIGKLAIPEVLGCDAIIKGARGNSMSDFINEGDWLGVKRVIDLDFIFWDYPYGIITDELEVIKYIKKAPTNNEVILVSHNKQYSDVLLPRKKIVHLFIVRVVLPFSLIKTII